MRGRLALFASVLVLTGCGLRPSQPDQTALQPEKPHPVKVSFFAEPKSFREVVEQAEQNAESGEDSTELLEQYGRHWLYGNGIGRTIANVGTVVAFPPYALYLLGNAGLTLAGYEPLYITSALPDGARDATLSVYDGITSVPGRIAATVAGEEFSE